MITDSTTAALFRRFLPCVLFVILLPTLLHAQNSYIEVNAPGTHLLKLAFESPRSSEKSAELDAARLASEVIVFDMNMSGGVNAEITPLQQGKKRTAGAEVDFTPWMGAGFDLLVRGDYTITGEQLTVEFRLFDVINRKMLTARRYLGGVRELRRFSHLFADEILKAITGEAGVFTTKIAYISAQTGNKEVYIMDWDGNNPLPLTKNGSINMNPAFSPDGREILFTSYKRGNPDLYRRSLSSTTEVLLSNRQGLNITGSYSPDGNTIALALSKDGDAEIYTIDKNGAHPNRLTINSALDLYPAWSPDGTRIAFVSDRLGAPQIFIMNADGSDVRRLTTAGNYNVNPRWSPRGDRIVYSRMAAGVFNIFSIAPDGSADTQLTTEGSNENPSWSPDGRFICFSSRRSAGDGIYVMRADGAAQTRTSREKRQLFQPVWSPH